MSPIRGLMTAAVMVAAVAARTMMSGETMKSDIQHLDEIAARRAEAGAPWLEFLDVPSMRAGLYELDAGARDNQGPHKEDEIYHVISGRAIFTVEGKRTPVRAGSIIYVEAGVEHRFVDIEEDLKVLVVFAAGS